MHPRDLRGTIGDLVEGTVPPEFGLQAPTGEERFLLGRVQPYPTRLVNWFMSK
jgi:hypothetical protein